MFASEEKIYISYFIWCPCMQQCKVVAKPHWSPTCWTTADWVTWVTYIRSNSRPLRQCLFQQCDCFTSPGCISQWTVWQMRAEGVSRDKKPRAPGLHSMQACHNSTAPSNNYVCSQQLRDPSWKMVCSVFPFFLADAMCLHALPAKVIHFITASSQLSNLNHWRCLLFRSKLYCSATKTLHSMLCEVQHNYILLVNMWFLKYDSYKQLLCFASQGDSFHHCQQSAQ